MAMHMSMRLIHVPENHHGEYYPNGIHVPQRLGMSMNHRSCSSGVPCMAMHGSFLAPNEQLIRLVPTQPCHPTFGC